MPPARKVAVVACMGARLHPSELLGLEIGDAHVIRNAGGRASDDAIRTLVISPFIPGEVPVSGFIYDVRSGRLEPVE